MELIDEFAKRQRATHHVVDHRELKILFYFSNVIYMSINMRESGPEA